MTEPYDPRTRPPHTQPSTSAYPYGRQWHGGEQRYDDRWWPGDGQYHQEPRPQDQWSQEQRNQDQWSQDQRSQEQWNRGQWRQDQWNQEQWNQEQWRQEQWNREQWRQEQWRQEQWRQEQPGGPRGWQGGDLWRGGGQWNDPGRLAGYPGEQPRWDDDRAYRTERRADASRWHWLLLIPIVVPLITPLYNRIEPKWFGLPFFYWSQLSFALLSTLVMVMVHLATKGRRRRG